MPRDLLEEIDASVRSSTMRLRVRFCETDLMGIVHHAAYLTYFEAARVEWLRRRGVTYADWARRHLHLPVVEAEVRYRAPAQFDDELEITTTLTELKAVSLRFAYRVSRGALLLTEGSTRLASVGQGHTLRRFPSDVLDVLRSAETAASPSP